MLKILLVAEDKGSDISEGLSSETELDLEARGVVRVRRMFHSLVSGLFFIMMASMKLWILGFQNTQSERELPNIEDGRRFMDFEQLSL